MKDKDTPLRLVRLWEKMNPGVYAELDRCRAEKDEGQMSWPDYCELPIGAAFTYLVDIADMSHVEAAMVAAELTACWTWRRCKKIFSFDDDLAAALAAQAEDVQDTDVLPADLLLHLPYPCVYIKAPVILNHIDGFFVWDEYDINTGKIELRIQWVTEDMDASFSQVLHLLPGHTLKECIVDTMRTSQEHLELDIDVEDAGVKEARLILSAIQLVLYIISESAELERIPMPITRSRVEGNVIHVKPADQDKASTVEEIKVGVRLGAALRKAKYSRTATGGEGGGTQRRSHTRRGHWHHYWTGPMSGERKLVLKWVAPTVIHPEAADNDNVVVYPVKG